MTHEQQAELDNIVTEDGYIVTPDGEIVGHVEDKVRFHVTDDASADWVLEKMLDLEASVAREDIKLSAIRENIEARKSALARRREWLFHRFGAEIEEYARRELEGKKERTLKMTFGSISFRATPGRLVVTDQEKALAIAKGKFPTAVKTTETLLVSQIPADWKLACAAGKVDGFGWSPPSESVTISTGVNRSTDRASGGAEP